MSVGIIVKSDSEIAAMRESGGMLAAVLRHMCQHTEPGVTPKHMSDLAKRELRALGGQPAFLGYHGYPDIICISVNDQVQHAIPDDRPFQAGDVVNYDFGVTYRGMITDAGTTVCVDDAFTPETKRLLEGTERALSAALETVRAGVRVGDISAAVQRVLERHKLGIVRELVGHGVGRQLHEDPEIPNYGTAGKGPVLRSGMTIAIEPITTLGKEAIWQADDGWTLYTVDGSWSAQFEHSILVLDDGCEILTR